MLFEERKLVVVVLITFRTQFFFVVTPFLNKGRNPNEEVTELQKHNRLAHSRKSEILVEGVKNKIKNEKKTQRVRDFIPGAQRERHKRRSNFVKPQ